MNKSLTFNPNGKFKIVIFADVQDQLPVHARVIEIMKTAIEREKPDLVVFLGDQTEMSIKDPETDFRDTLEVILAPVVDAGLPYAFVFGNHDDQSYYIGTRADKSAMLRVYQSIGDCRIYDASTSIFGVANCIIPIYSSNSDKILFELFMIDSNTYIDPLSESGGYDNPHPDQMEWFIKNRNKGVNAIVFQHIPMPEIYDLLVRDENGEKIHGGAKYALCLNDKASGHIGEYPCPPESENNTGEFTSLKAMGGVLGVFTGHDHLNDFSGTVDGIKMTSVPGLTYFNYGDEAARGYGVLELYENDLSYYKYKTVKISNC